MNNDPKAALLEAGKTQATSAVKGEYANLKGWITGGPIGLRVLSFFAGEDFKILF
jgi:hypothetical protein